ncbi:histidinol-phosphatase [Synchytrium microbalum]|uniref:histidinol-phosphatase n=1 Tax=Synchytrium microbalum TaxID=1806994 RepID=A0A507C8A0_9FUNG|nr:histidinol-phosphatase [Synchytrium microbalum]TPX33753.1 histidinol-phosphatase [Synchytrium microbalum]
MPISLHSHSGQYCQHAHGQLEQVIQKAIAMEFTCFGLSEHMPRSLDRDLYPEEVQLGMSPSSLSTTYQDFITEARRLISQCQTPTTTLLLGMETEYIRISDLDAVSTLRALHNIDYIVGSVHHVAEIPLDYNEEMYASIESLLGGTETVFRVYFNAQYEMLKQLKPEVVGHFDLVRLFRPEHGLSDVVMGLIERNIEWIAEYGGLVEINSRALKKNLGSPYPFRDILQKMIANKIKFTLSDDSHGPNDVAMHYDKLRDYLIENNITSVYSLAKDQDGKVTVKEHSNISAHPFWSKNCLIPSVESTPSESLATATRTATSPASSPDLVAVVRPTSPLSIKSASSCASPRMHASKHNSMSDIEPKLPGSYPSNNSNRSEMDSSLVSESELVVSEAGVVHNHSDDEVGDHEKKEEEVKGEVEEEVVVVEKQPDLGVKSHESLEESYIITAGSVDEEEFVIVEPDDALDC